MIDKNCNQNIPSNQRVVVDKRNGKTYPNQNDALQRTNNSATSKSIPVNNSNNNNSTTTSATNSAAKTNEVMPPYPPGPNKRLSKNDLYPPTPSIMVHKEAEVYSPQLQEFCLANPIAVIRNISNVLNLNLGLFSTKTLVDADSDHQIEVRTQLQQPSDQNWDLEKKKMIWRCESPRNFSKIAKYASYQASTFQEYLMRDEKKRKTSTDSNSFNNNNTNHLNNYHCYENSTSPASKSSSAELSPLNNYHYSKSPNDNSDSDSNGSGLGPTSTSTSSRIFRKLKKNAQFNVVTFGTNVDLSDNKKWKAQLDELNKLPPFARVVSASNMLTHVGHSILGMNTVQLYMKVPGCRTPGHQENNNFCSVNINIGPGDCEWFGVPEEYWGPMAKLCAENNTNFVHGSWWPNLDDLYAYNIPVYRFIQKPGELVWVNTGTVHWVQAIGWCNNIAWNVGPITSKQYKSAILRYEWNKNEKYKSIVPMIHLTLNLARNVEIHDEDLFNLIKNFMGHYINHCLELIKKLKKNNFEIKWHGKADHEAAYYCATCEREVFNILFVKSIEKKLVVHCATCAIATSQILENFIILQEYDTNYLEEIYSNFKLSKESGRITNNITTNSIKKEE